MDRRLLLLSYSLQSAFHSFFVPMNRQPDVDCGMSGGVPVVFWSSGVIGCLVEFLDSFAAANSSESGECMTGMMLFLYDAWLSGEFMAHVSSSMRNFTSLLRSSYVSAMSIFRLSIAVGICCSASVAVVLIHSTAAAATSVAVSAALFWSKTTVSVNVCVRSRIFVVLHLLISAIRCWPCASSFNFVSMPSSVSSVALRLVEWVIIL